MKHLVIFLLLISSLRYYAQSPDLTVLQSINATEHPQWDDAMKFTSASIYPVCAIAPATLLITGYVRKDKTMMRNGLKSYGALALNIAVTSGLKYAIKRERPYYSATNGIIKRSDSGPYSFPSGHTSTAFSMATSMTLSTKKWYVAVPCYLYAGTVGYSRMRLGVHYPSDVLGGMLVGAGSAFLTWQLDKWINNKRKSKKTVN